ncbi:MAG: dCTP deaminase [Nitrospirae bacterium]|nr:dCTP deaminase [Nitrospirota bacterium]
MSNLEIIKAISDRRIIIDPKPDESQLRRLLNTTSLDFRLGNIISIPHDDVGVTIDSKNGIKTKTLKTLFDRKQITEEGGYTLRQNKFVLSNTYENISLPYTESGPNYAARIEGKSSYARFGLLVHFTAPTIHADFSGTITLELMNLGPFPITLYPNVPICQIVFEKVEGEIANSPSQFQGQTTPEGSH